MSEAAGAHTLNTNEFFRIDSVGKTLPGMETLLFQQDANKQGEVKADISFHLRILIF